MDILNETIMVGPLLEPIYSREANMMMSLAKSRGPFERARSNAETIANNLYYSLTLNTYIMKFERLSLPVSIDIDDIMQNDFVVGNLLMADAIIQKAQRTSA